MEDGKYELSVLVDSACGGSSIQDGQLGTMLHRPMLADDGRGVGEALDEIVCVENDGEGLTPCLGGDSKTLMFVNISPEASSASESICSLQFAARVNA